MQLDGFSLIELLIVLSIIAILMAVLIPGLIFARQAANNSSTQSFTRNMVAVAEAKRAVGSPLRAFAINCAPSLIDQIPDTVDSCQYRQDENATYVLALSKSGKYYRFDGQTIQGPLASPPSSW